MRTVTPRIIVLLALCYWLVGCDRDVSRQEATLHDTVCRLAITRPLVPSTEPEKATGGARQGFALELCQKGSSTWRRITDRRNGAFLDFSQPPQRILSQSLGSDEMLLALMPEQERHRLIAVSALSLSPRYSDIVEDAARVGRVITDKTEEILALAPDLVLAASYSTPETLRQLENAHVPTIVLHQFAGVDDTIGNLRTLAFALFLDPEGERLANELTATVEQAKALIAPLLQQHENQTLRVVAYGAGSVNAQGTTFDDLAARLGLLNLPAAEGLTGWPRADQEQLLAWGPQLVFLSAPVGAYERSADFFRSDFSELFQSSHPSIVVLPDHLFSTVSQRLGTLALEMAIQMRSALQ